MKNTSQKTPTITLKKIVHRNQEQLFILFKYYIPYINVLRNNSSFKWSQTQKGWYTNFSNENIDFVKNIFQQAQIKIDASISEIINPSNIKKKQNLLNESIILLYIKYLKGKKYSENTIKTYSVFITGFINYIANKPLKELTNRDVELFMNDVFIPKKMNSNSQKQLILAIKLFKDFYPEYNINKVQLQRL